MRKGLVKILAAMMVVSVFLLGGCSTQKAVTAESLMKEANANMEKAKSFKGDMDMQMEISVSAEGYTMDLGIGMTGPLEMTIDPQVLHMAPTMNMNLMGQDMGIDMDIYTQVDGDKAIVYTGMNGMWSKTEEAVGEEAGIQDLYASLGDGTEMTLEKETQKIGDREVYVLTSVVSGEKLQALLEGMGDVTQGVEVDLTSMQANATTMIYKDTMLPAAAKVELIDNGEGVETEGILTKISKMILTMNYNEYDTIDSIEIPEEALAAGELDISSLYPEETQN